MNSIPEQTESIDLKFGTWLKHERERRRLNIRELADKGRLNIGSVSRIETLSSQPTLQTAIRLVNVLGFSMQDFIASWTGHTVQEMVEHSNEGIAKGKHLLTLNDVVNIIDFWHNGRKPQLLAWFTDTAIKVSESLENKSQSEFHSKALSLPNNIAEMLFFQSPLLTIELPYPPPNPDQSLYYDLLSEYRSGGVFTPIDMNVYIADWANHLRGDPTFNEHSNLLIGIAKKSIDKLKIDEIFSTQLRQAFIQSDEIGMFWRAYKYADDLANAVEMRGIAPRSSFQDYELLASRFITLHRWVHLYSRKYVPEIDEQLRACIT